MTISTEVRKAGPFIGNGSASVFPFAFKVFKAADLIVVRRQDNIGEETTLVLDSDYHVTLNGNQDTTPGGVVTLVAGALASGFTLVVSSELPYLQPTDLTNQGGFYPKVITNALDRLTIFCQQLAEITGRTLKLPITAPTNISAEIPLPNPSELIAWDETGTRLTTVSPQSLVTSIAYGSATADLFAGDGITTTFPLSTNPASVNNLDVSIDGHSQRPVQGGIGDYSWNGGASITFASPPPAPTVPGDKNVLVRYMQAIPVSDSEALHAQTREALRRSYAEAGYNLVDGSFETGGTLASTSDVLLLESAGTAYAWTGAYPVGGYDVAPGIDPTVVPGYVPRKNVVLRSGLLDGALSMRNGMFALRDMVSIRDAGGVGDGVADDTAALQATIARNASFSLFDMELLAQPVSSSGTITKSGAIISGPGVFKVKPGSYAVGIPGSVDSYSFAKMNADGGCIINTSFDGNGQATLLPYQSTGANVHFFPVVMYGGKKGQKAIGNHSTGAGGHAIDGGNGSLMLMLGNSADYHNGIGTTNTDSVVMAGMTSANTTDSHYYSNSNHGLVAAAVVGSGSTGGGGIDIAGGSDVVVGASSFSGCKKHGAWVLKSPNTSEQYNRVLINGVLSHNNCLYPDDEQGEITIGDQSHLSDAQGADAAVVGNLLCPRDTPSGAGYNAGLWVHKGATRTAGVANVFSPDDALISGNQPVIKDMGSTKPIYASNVCFGGTSGKVYFDAAPSGYSYYANNINMRIHPLSKLPSAMESSDAVWPYHIVRPLTKAGIRLLEVSYLGGFVHDVIDITLTQTGDNGAAAYRVVLRGAVGLTTAVLAMTKLWEAGTNPPQVTVNAGVGIATVSANTAPSGFDGESCAFDIRVVTPQDEALRFKPIFSA